MIMTPALAGLTPAQWDDQFFREYVRENRFRRYMGTGESSLIQLREDLTRKPGDSVVFAAVRQLTAAGVTGSAVLEGNEEVLDQRSLKVQVDVLRHGVAVTDWDEQKSTIDLRNAARLALKDWCMVRMRDQIVQALGSLDGVPFATATAAQRNAWLGNNGDRVLFGQARGNSTGTMSTSLANVDATNDALTPGVVSLAKRIAKTAKPAIRPVRVGDDEEWFVLFAHPLAFRDLANDPAMRDANRMAMERGKDNPLFSGGDLLWDGVVIREIPEIPAITGAGAAGIDVAPCYLAGAQAVGVAWAQRTRSTTNDRDYGFRHGVGVQEVRGIQKLRFGRQPGADGATPTDNGVVSVFVAGVADA